MSKETKGARRRRVFSGMNIADLRLLKEHKALPRGMKAEELDAEIKRREVIAERTTGQNRAGGRFAEKSSTPTFHPLEERLKVEPVNPVGHRRITGLGEHVKSMIRQIVQEELNKGTINLFCPKCHEKLVHIDRRLDDQERVGSTAPPNFNEPGLLRRLKRWLL